MRCFDCFRPVTSCICPSIPWIDNQTAILILQHKRERWHRFNTARIVRRALRNSDLLIGYPDDFSFDQLPLLPRTGLLYPGDQARMLSDLPAAERPEQLVILDGTWHHAKTFVRDIPGLANLPRYQILPAQPGRYRIRREPDDQSLSTLEATVAALQTLESDIAGLERLMTAFDEMIECQLDHPHHRLHWRRKANRRATSANIPRVLNGDLKNIVVAYGESAPGVRRSKADVRRLDRSTPIYWVAQRLVKAPDTHVDHFCHTVLPSPEAHPRVFTPQFLRHVDMPAEAFAHGLSVNEFRAAWAAFLQPSDTLCVYNSGTAKLLTHTGTEVENLMVLKSVNFCPRRSYTTLDELIRANNLIPPRPIFPGRAGRRLANAVALVEHLHGLLVAGDKQPRV